MKKHNLKFSVLGIVFSGFGLLFFLSYFFLADISWVVDIHHNVANVVGISAAVPPNEYNTLAQQMKEKQQDLDEMERNIKEREIALSEVIAGKSSEYDRMAFAGAGVSGVLFALVGLNFYWDRKRKT